jgi:hypothetical protein
VIYNLLLSKFQLSIQHAKSLVKEEDEGENAQKVCEKMVSCTCTVVRMGRMRDA